MTSYTIYSNTDDVDIYSASTSLSASYTGIGSTKVVRSNTFDPLYSIAYRDSNDLNFYTFQSLLHFDTSSVAGTVSSASLTLNYTSVSAALDIDVSEKAWTSGSEVFDGFPGSLTQFSNSLRVSSAGSTTFTKLTTTLSLSSTYGLIVFDHRQISGVTPGDDNSALFSSADHIGTTSDPYLTIVTAAAAAPVFRRTPYLTYMRL